jgi:hypothetical protein
MSSVIATGKTLKQTKKYNIQQAYYSNYNMLIKTVRISFTLLVVLFLEHTQKKKYKLHTHKEKEQIKEDGVTV